MLQTFLPTFLKIKCDTFFFTIQMKKAKSCFVFSEHSVCVLSADTDEHTVECIQKVQRKGSGGLVIYIRTIMWSQTRKQ